MKIASDEEMRRRDAILAEVKNIFLKFIQLVAIKELNMTEDEAEEAGGDIFISGSHRLDLANVSRSNKVLYLDDCLNRFTDSLYDPEKGFKSSTKEGLEFFIEHYTWKRLPPEVFEPWGGKDFAKAKRHELGYGRKKSVTNELTNKNTNQPEETSYETKTNESVMQANDSNNDSKETIKQEVSTENQDNEYIRKRKFSEDLTTTENKLAADIKLDISIPQYFPIEKRQNIRPFNVPNVVWNMIENC
eukprot:gene21743-28138_t